MSLKTQFIKNTSIVGVARFVENIISYLIIILLTRNLGAQGLGDYSFIFAFVGFFFIFSDLGLSQMLIKDLSKKFSKVDKYISNIFSLRTILIFTSFLVYVGVLFFIDTKGLFLELIIAGLAMCFQKMYWLYLSLLRVKQEGKKIAWIRIIERSIVLVGSFIVFYFTKNFLLFIILFFVSYLIQLILSFAFSKKYYELSLKLNFKFLKKLIIRGLPFVFVGIFSLVYVRMDSVMLGFMKNTLVVGYYNASYKLIKVLNVIPAIFLMFGFPLFSKLFKENKKALKKLFESIMNYSLVLILPIAVGVFYVGDRVLKVIYDITAVESFISFKILIIAEIFVFMTMIMGQFIASADKQKVFAYIGGIGAFVNIILNFILIPKYSLYGAGYATLFTYFLMFVLMFVYIKKSLLKFSFFKYLIAPFIGCILMWIVLINILYLNLVWIVLICAIVYFIPIVFQFLLKKDFLGSFKKIIKGN